MSLAKSTRSTKEAKTPPPGAPPPAYPKEELLDDPSLFLACDKGPFGDDTAVSLSKSILSTSDL